MYIKHYEEEFNTLKMVFLIENPEKTERDFIESKIEKINQSELEYKRKCNFTDEEAYQEIRKTGIVINYINKGFDKSQKLDFDKDLENRLLKFRERYTFKEKKEESRLLTFYKTKLKNLPNTKSSNEEVEPLDLSNLSAVKKVIYLKELGIIDLLQKQPCFYAVNNLATVLSSITGEKPTTLQAILNPMINTKGTAQKNNPYNTITNVNKVKKQLIELGFQPK